MKAAVAQLLACCFTTSVNAATVVSVGDGDTIRVSEGAGESPSVSLVDAQNLPSGLQGEINRVAKAANAGWHRSDVEVQTTDRYGRTVAELLNRRGNVNQLMVGADQAFAYRRYPSVRCAEVSPA